MHPQLIIQKDRTNKKRLVPDSLTYPVPPTLKMEDHCTLAGSADSPLFVCRDHSTPPLLGSEHGMGSAGFRLSYADNFGVLHVSLQVFRKPVSLFTT